MKRAFDSSCSIYAIDAALAAARPAKLLPSTGQATSCHKKLADGSQTIDCLAINQRVQDVDKQTPMPGTKCQHASGVEIN